MADSYGDRDVNLSALQRVDQYIVEVLSSATQVALYKFSSEDNEWARTGVEGTLFVYRRSALPFYGFLIMNRLSKTNQVEPITKDLELKKEDPYLLYRNLKLNIFGIWFYEPNDCVKISDAVNRLLTHEKEKHRSQQRIRRASESDTGMNKRGENADIFSMLSKAQEVYLKNTTLEPKPIVESPNAGAAAAASAVIIRPRAVRVGGGGGGAPDVTRTTPSNLLTPEPNAKEEEKKQLTIEDLFARASDVSIGRAGGGVILPPVTELSTQQNPILQRLMSNPENLVEHIEKRQRNETLPLSQLPEEKPKTFARISTSSSTETNVESSSSPKSHMDSFFTPAMFETPDPVTPFITPTKQPPSFPQTLHMSLMSPMMFSTPMSFTANPLDRRFPPQLPDLEDGDIEPLTKAQLVQAFTHLLKTDSLFVNKLHEAYVKTLQRRSNNNNKNGWERKSNGLF